MLENIKKIFKKKEKKEDHIEKTRDAAKERLHLVLMQDRANVSADFLEMMKQEIIDVIKKYVDVDESEIDVRLTNQINDDGTNGAPALYANIPIIGIKNEIKGEKIKEGKEKGIINDKNNLDLKNVINENGKNKKDIVNQETEKIDIKTKIEKEEEKFLESLKVTPKKKSEKAIENTDDKKIRKVQKKSENKIDEADDLIKNEHKKEKAKKSDTSATKLGETDEKVKKQIRTKSVSKKSSVTKSTATKKIKKSVLDNDEKNEIKKTSNPAKTKKVTKKVATKKEV